MTGEVKCYRLDQSTRFAGQGKSHWKIAHWKMKAVIGNLNDFNVLCVCWFLNNKVIVSMAMMIVTTFIVSTLLYDLNIALGDYDRCMWTQDGIRKIAKQIKPTSYW
nr:MULTISPECIES: hypothetical protein [Providencia]